MPFPIKATRTPGGMPPARGGPPPAVRYAANPMWPGLATRTALCSCTRAMKDGVYQVKFRDVMCEEHRGAGG